MGLYCPQYRQLTGFEKRLKQGGVDVYEADIFPPERYMMERFITAPVWFSGEAQQSGPLAEQRIEAGDRLSSAIEAGFARHRNQRARRALFDRARRLRTASGLYAGAAERRRRRTRLRTRILRNPRTVARQAEYVDGAARPRRDHRLESGAVRFARAATARRTISRATAARPRRCGDGMARAWSDAEPFLRGRGGTADYRRH